MAAEKKGATIVIKKYYSAAGHHGGSWKVALADFMTAMMAFFLVMWLLGQTPETKKAVSDYFSRPSVIEYNYENFGAEITLEKLFLDLINEPLKAVQSFVEPSTESPNLLDLGSQKLVAAFLADQMGDIAKNVSISPDGMEFDIVDKELFEPGSSKPNPQFINAMERLKGISVGLQDAELHIYSFLFKQSVVGSDMDVAQIIADERLDLIQKKMEASMEQPSVSVIGHSKVEVKEGFVEGQMARPPGLIRIKIKQKAVKEDGSKPRPLEKVFGTADVNGSVYENFAKQVSEQKNKVSQKEVDKVAPPKAVTKDTKKDAIENNVESKDQSAE